MPVDETLRYEAELKKILAGRDGHLAARIMTQVEHFTDREAEHRDEIMLGYFGRDGVARIVDMIASRISREGRGRAPSVLDVGAGVGTFTAPLFRRMGEEGPRPRFFAMDATPAMLRVLSARVRGATTFVGIAEDLTGSIKVARESAVIPSAFDVILSTLMLHHCLDTERVLASIASALGPGGIAVLVDLCKHPFTEFRGEMGDVHLGFDLRMIRRLAQRTFDRSSVTTLPSNCRCSDTGRVVDLFMLAARREDN